MPASCFAQGSSSTVPIGNLLSVVARRAPVSICSLHREGAGGRAQGPPALELSADFHTTAAFLTSIRFARLLLNHEFLSSSRPTATRAPETHLSLTRLPWRSSQLQNSAFAPTPAQDHPLPGEGARER